MRHEKQNVSPQIYEAPKALTVLIVQQPQTINLFKQIKLPRTWNRFCFAFWALADRAASLLHHKIRIAAPSRQETRTAHRNTHKKTQRQSNTEAACMEVLISPPFRQPWDVSNQLLCKPATFAADFHPRVSTHKYRFTKQKKTSLLFDPSSVTFSLCDDNCQFLLVLPPLLA